MTKVKIAKVKMSTVKKNGQGKNDQGKNGRGKNGQGLGINGHEKMGKNGEMAKGTNGQGKYGLVKRHPIQSLCRIFYTGRQLYTEVFLSTFPHHTKI